MKRMILMAIMAIAMIMPSMAQDKARKDARQDDRQKVERRAEFRRDDMRDAKRCDRKEFKGGKKMHKGDLKPMRRDKEDLRGQARVRGDFRR